MHCFAGQLFGAFFCLSADRFFNCNFLTVFYFPASFFPLIFSVFRSFIFRFSVRLLFASVFLISNDIFRLPDGSGQAIFAVFGFIVSVWIFGLVSACFLLCFVLVYFDCALHMFRLVSVVFLPPPKPLLILAERGIPFPSPVNIFLFISSFSALI